METINTCRAQVYRFLARVFRVEIDSDFVNQMRMLDIQAMRSDSSEETGYKRMYSYVSSGRSGILLDLARDYARCFIGTGLPQNCAAYPYESVYTSEEGLMEQEARDEVMFLYAAESLVKESHFKEPDDHIAFELEFMAFLADKADEAMAAGDQATTRKYHIKQEEFLTKHLYRWVYEFCNRLEKVARTDFYRGAAVLTRAFLHSDKTLLDEAAEEMGIAL